jgi:uncharacterized lipoprotein NlpE involved in copper resistance
MKKKNLVLLLSIALASCKNGTPDEKSTNPSNSQSAVASTGNIYMDLAGIYQDTLPCANCPGIITELTIQPDTTFILRERFLSAEGRPTKSDQMKGVYSFSDNEKKMKLTSSAQGAVDRFFEISNGVIISTSGEGNTASKDMSLELQEKIVSKIGADFVLYKTIPFVKYPTQVFSYITGNGIHINKAYLDVAPEAEKALIAFYALQYSSGCDEKNCALPMALGMDETQLRALVSKWMPSIPLPSAEEVRSSKGNGHLATLYFIQNNGNLQVNYNILSPLRQMSMAMDEYKVGQNDITLVRKGDMITQGNSNRIAAPAVKALPAGKERPVKK